MKMTLAQISQLVEGELQGAADLEIIGVSGIEDAEPGHITFAADNKNLKLLEGARASAVLCPPRLETGIPAVRVAHPALAFAKLLEVYHPSKPLKPGVDPGAYLGEGVTLGRDVKVYPFVYIGEGARIGDRVVIHPGASVGERAVVDDDTIIYSNVSVYNDVSIGKRTIIHSGAVIGSDGYGFARTPEGTHYKIPQVGTVKIEDDVEIGANVCIDRANLKVTHIKRGTKIDNLVHIAHNNVVGENNLLLAHVGISGSCRLGRNVTLAGQVGTIDHISIGDNSIVIAQSGVAHDVPENSLVAGSPAMPHGLWKRVQLSLQKLPTVIKSVKKLEKKLDELKGEIEEAS